MVLGDSTVEAVVSNSLPLGSSRAIPKHNLNA